MLQKSGGGNKILPQRINRTFSYTLIYEKDKLIQKNLIGKSG